LFLIVLLLVVYCLWLGTQAYLLFDENRRLVRTINLIDYKRVGKCLIILWRITSKIISIWLRLLYQKWNSY